MNTNKLGTKLNFSDLITSADGFVPVVVQENTTNEVLMMAYMNEEAFNKTLESGLMTYYSRSRKELWVKGETSGHYQHVVSLTADCDMDSILARVKQVGVACHTGASNCFFNAIIEMGSAGASTRPTEGRNGGVNANNIYNRKPDMNEVDIDKNPATILNTVFEIINDRKINPKEGSYTNYLFDKGIDKILKKIGEESTEIVIAAKNPDNNELVYEMSDYLYHMMVLMVEKGIGWDEIFDELAKR